MLPTSPNYFWSSSKKTFQWLMLGIYFGSSQFSPTSKKFLQIGESWFLSVCFVFAVSQTHLWSGRGLNCEGTNCRAFPVDLLGRMVNQVESNEYECLPTKTFTLEVSHHLKKWSLLKAYTFKWVVHHQLKNGESKFQGLYRTHHNRSVSTWVANLKETQSDLNT